MHLTGMLDPAPRRVAARQWMLGAGYLCVFLLLDWISYIRPLQGLNITPWSPQTALAIALLLWRPRWTWLVWIGLVVAELVVRGLPDDAFVLVCVTLALTLVYKLAARIIESRVDRSLVLARRRDLLWLLGVSLAAALVSALAYVTLHAAAGGWTFPTMRDAAARYWLGDAVGLVVALPIALVLSDGRRRVEVWRTLGSRTWWLICAAIGLLLWLVFGRADPDAFRFFYLLLLPVTWAAARLGLAGAVLASALTQLGLIAALQSGQDPDLTVFELQALMAVLTLAGLLLGVAVDEQARAAAELQRSLRLAAAGQMAAALAHELSQPLTALSNYAQACRMLMDGQDVLPQERYRQLAETTRRMSDDAQRAGEVVKRLRDFFRQGTTRLQPADIGALVNDAVDAQRRRAESLGVTLHVDTMPGLPKVLADSIQIEVVLRNLLANGIDAAASQGQRGRVAFRLTASDDVLRVDVVDNGPGIDAERMQRLFEPGASDKPGGMGVGLSICRAIVEAHGGRLWAESAGAGAFAFTLPIDDDEPASSSRHAQ